MNLDEFRTLPSSKATGAKQIGRLTNLQKLNVDTSWYTRYRSTQNPDFGATFPQAVNIQNEPAIPLNDADTPPGHVRSRCRRRPRQQQRMQAIANTAGFHFAMIEQGGSSLYTTMSLKVIEPRGAADRGQHRRRRGQPLRRLARQGRERRRPAAGRCDGPRDAA